MDIETVLCKVNKGISIIKKLWHTLPGKWFQITCKAFLRPYINYDQPFIESFCEKLESVKHKAVLAIIGAIQRTSRETIFMELGLESLKSRR